MQLDGTHSKVVLQAAHRNVAASIHWDLDGTYLGTTTGDHRLTAEPSDGPHRLTLTDNDGQRIAITFRTSRSTDVP